MWSLTSQRERRTGGPENFQSSAKKDFFNSIPPRAAIRQHRRQQPPMTGQSGYVAAQLPIAGWPGARSSGGRGLASPVVPGGVSFLAVFVSTRSSVFTVAASLAMI